MGSLNSLHQISKKLLFSHILLNIFSLLPSCFSFCESISVLILWDGCRFFITSKEVHFLSSHYKAEIYFYYTINWTEKLMFTCLTDLWHSACLHMFMYMYSITYTHIYLHMAPLCVNVTHSVLSFMTCFEILKLFVVDETLKEIAQFSTLWWP